MNAARRNEIITIRGLNKTFGSGDTAVTALSGIDLTIYEGEIFGIIGLSGAGKSTLVPMLRRAASRWNPWPRASSWRPGATWA